MSDNAFSMQDWPEPDPASVPLTRAEAVELLAEQTGRSRDVAETMVRDYLDDTSARLGYSVHQWGLDTGDVAEIRRGYEWVDYERGENPADARARAAVNAAGWAETAAGVGREQSPGYASRAEQQAAVWAERAEDGWSA
ncbi:hypothetical protein LWC33_07740 [Pseudonocardia sp. RS11V-5]|uniref:hypothetical protein n=1 Tax=Pseudonocardia terrae TaxID=2905831 RepID=UPI001E349225|nr:hypothetical protein [Pseudonocardia terrae]MCE3551343.1 hypothetical protein [Pseudonocardia terrae]